jgi:hypothetical protein
VVPSAVALKCDAMQLDQRPVVELASDVDPVSAVNREPMLYPQAGMELSGSTRRTPPKREQQADTALSLLPQHPIKHHSTFFQAGMASGAYLERWVLRWWRW